MPRLSPLPGRIRLQKQGVDAVLKRTVFFVYGCVAYLVFLATLLYAIAFVGGCAVPIRLDEVPRIPLRNALAIDAGLLTVFAVQHSARPTSSSRAWR